MPATSLMTSKQWGSKTLKNRVAMAPMTRARGGVERLANARIAKYYADRAAAGHEDPLNLRSSGVDEHACRETQLPQPSSDRIIAQHRLEPPAKPQTR